MRPPQTSLVRVLPGLPKAGEGVYEEVELPSVKRIEYVSKRRRGIVRDNTIAPRATVNPRKENG